MFKKLSLILLSVLSFSSFAAEEYSLWPIGTTVAAPYTDGIIATSSEIFNNSGFNSTMIVVNFEDATPDQCKGDAADYKLFIKIEGNINGNWFPLGTSFSPYNNCNNGPQRIIIIDPKAPDMNYVDFDIAEANKIVTRISYNIATLTNGFRVKLRLEGGSNLPLSSVTFSAYGRKYNSE